MLRSFDSYGTHISFRDNIYDTLLFHTQKLEDCKVFQIYIGSNRSYKRTSIDEKDLNESSMFCNENKVKLFAHQSLLYNLAGKCTECVPAWVNDTPNSKYSTMKLMCSNITEELRITSKCNGGCVVHPGAWKDKKEGRDMAIKTLNYIDYPEESFLLLENSAGEGNKIAHRLEDIQYMIDGVSPNKRDRVAVCLDTAHMFGSGMSEMKDGSDIDTLFERIKSTVGIDKIKLIHLNDSEVRFKGCADKHASIGTGHIWGESPDSLFVLTYYCKKYNIPMCLETTPSDYFVIRNMFNSDVVFSKDNTFLT